MARKQESHSQMVRKLESIMEIALRDMRTLLEQVEQERDMYRAENVMLKSKLEQIRSYMENEPSAKAIEQQQRIARKTERAKRQPRKVELPPRRQKKQEQLTTTDMELFMKRRDEQIAREQRVVNGEE